MAYIGTSPSNGVRRVFDYTATAGQTSFSGSDNNSQTLAYTDSAYIDVYQNGILLIPSDYTATTGTTVVLDTGATVSDTVQIVAYDVFSVADTVSASDGGSFGGNLGVGGNLSVTGATTLGTKLATSNLGAGAVLQVQYFQLLTPQTESYGTTNTAMPITNFNVNITPKSTSSIIKLEANMTFEWANAAWNTMWFFYRDSTALTGTGASNRNVGISPSLINYHTDNSSTLEFATFTYFDTPSSTSQITYKVGVVSAGTDDLYINGTINQTDSVEYERGVSVFSATEIAG